MSISSYKWYGAGVMYWWEELKQLKGTGVKLREGTREMPKAVDRAIRGNRGGVVLLEGFGIASELAFAGDPKFSAIHTPR